MPETAILVLDRPRVMLSLSDVELRTKIREELAKREAEIRAEQAGKCVVGMKAARQIHWSTLPRQGEELFGRRPGFSTQTQEQRRAMKRLRRRFVPEHSAALARWNAGERNVVFPAGTVGLRLRHNALTEPIPLDLLLAG